MSSILTAYVIINTCIHWARLGGGGGGGGGHPRQNSTYAHAEDGRCGRFMTYYTERLHIAPCYSPSWSTLYDRNIKCYVWEQRSCHVNCFIKKKKKKKLLYPSKSDSLLDSVDVKYVEQKKFGELWFYVFYSTR